MLWNRSRIFLMYLLRLYFLFVSRIYLAVIKYIRLLFYVFSFIVFVVILLSFGIRKILKLILTIIFRLVIFIQSWITDCRVTQISHRADPNLLLGFSIFWPVKFVLPHSSSNKMYVSLNLAASLLKEKEKLNDKNDSNNHISKIWINLIQVIKFIFLCNPTLCCV